MASSKSIPRPLPPPIHRPGRVQRSRKAGYRLPPLTKCVTCGTPFGNPFYVGPVKKPGDPFVCATAEEAVEKYIGHVQGDERLQTLIKVWLRGWNLACYCKPDEPCHADYLLRIANE